MPFISVILTAYNRKEFIYDALTSLKNQVYKDFEVIFISNFEYSIEEFHSLNIRHIIMDGTIGEYLTTGMKESSGEIISFLDDDDLFLESKLQKVKNIFEDNDIVYFHNSSSFIDEYGNTINKQNNGLDFNMSSISIRKNIINEDILKSIPGNPDTFMYISALESSKKIVISNETITYYRQHNSLSNFKTQNYGVYKEKIIAFKLSNLSFYNYVINHFKSKKSLNFIKARVFINLLFLYSCNKKYRPKHLANFLFFYKDNNKLSYLFEYIALLIFKNSARKILDNRRRIKY